MRQNALIRKGVKGETVRKLDFKQFAPKRSAKGSAKGSARAKKVLKYSKSMEILGQEDKNRVAFKVRAELFLTDMINKDIYDDFLIK